MAVNYLQRVHAARRGDIGEGIRSGLAAGESLSPLFKSLGEAINQYKKDKIANELMNQQTGQPGGGITQSLGKLPGGSAASDGGDIDNLGTLGDEALIPGDTTTPAAAAPQDMTLPATSGGGGQTVGSLMPHTGGVAEMKLRQEYEKAQLENELKRAEISGTGRYAKRALPYKRGVNTSGGTGGAWEKNDQAVSTSTDQTDQEEKPLGDEPVDSFEELNKRVDSMAGQKGTVGYITNNINTTTQDKNGNYVVTDTNGNARTYDKDTYETVVSQVNQLRKRNKMSQFPHPGQVKDDTLGTETNPYVLRSGSKLEIAALPTGAVARLPDGSLIRAH
jgi:hypothetical protein